MAKDFATDKLSTLKSRAFKDAVVENAKSGKLLLKEILVNKYKASKYNLYSKRYIEKNNFASYMQTLGEEKIKTLDNLGDDDINNIAKECANYCRQIAINPEKVNFLYFQAKNKQRNDSELERTVSHEFRSNEMIDSETKSEKTAAIRSTNTEIDSEFADAKQKALFDFLSNYSN